MTTRRDKITQLREQVNKMQTELKMLEKCENEPSEKWNFITHVRELNINTCRRDSKEQFQTPTRNMSKENKSPRKKYTSGCFTTREQERSNIDHNLPKTLRDIINKINDDFLVQSRRLSRDQLESPKSQDKSIFYKTAYVGKRYEHNHFGQRREEPSKSPKIRTYAFRPTDTIVNPERQLTKGIKIVKKIEKSPNNMLTQNPKSNPNLYLFNTTQPVFIQKKTHLQDKNKSSIVLSPSTSHMIPAKDANSVEKQKQSQKRHFERHIQQNICSRHKTQC